MSSLNRQQKEFDRFRPEYNYDRPREALKNRKPAQIYKRSRREFPEQIPEVAYSTSYEAQRVSEEGNIRYGIHRVFVSSALAG